MDSTSPSDFWRSWFGPTTNTPEPNPKTTPNCDTVPGTIQEERVEEAAEPTLDVSSALALVSNKLEDTEVVDCEEKEKAANRQNQAPEAAPVPSQEAPVDCGGGCIDQDPALQISAELEEGSGSLNRPAASSSATSTGPEPQQEAEGDSTFETRQVPTVSTTDIVLRRARHSSGDQQDQQQEQLPIEGEKEEQEEEEKEEEEGGMGQSTSQVFLTPPYVTDVSTLVDYWADDDSDDRAPAHHRRKQQQQQQPQQTQYRASRRSRTLSSSSYIEENIVVVSPQPMADGAGRLTPQQACCECGNLLSSDRSHEVVGTSNSQALTHPWNGFGAPPIVTLATLTRSCGVELVLAKDMELGEARLPLEGLDGSEELLIALSDRTCARLPARTLVAKAGKGEVTIQLDGGNALVYRVERAIRRHVAHEGHHHNKEQQHGHVSRWAGEEQKEGEGVLIAVPVPRMSDRETQLATILVGLAAVHRSLTGLTLILVALVLVGEACKRRMQEEEEEEERGFRRRRSSSSRYSSRHSSSNYGRYDDYPLDEWDLELIAERCQLGAEQQQQLEELLRRRPRNNSHSERHMTVTTTTTTTTTMSSSDTHVTMRPGQHVHNHHHRSPSHGARRHHHHHHQRHVSFSSTSSRTEEVTYQARNNDGSETSTIRLQRSSDTSSSGIVVEEVVETEEERLRREMQRFKEETLAEAAAEEYRRQVEQHRMEALMRAMPQRYLSVSNNIQAEAERRWRATLQWREEQAIDTFLDTPHVNFDFIKKLFPQYMAGRSRSGIPVYWENTALIDVKRLKNAGISVNHLLWHQVYICEFIYSRLITNKEDKMVTVVDVTGLYMSNLPGFLGDPLDFVLKALQIVQRHYPERNEVLLVINAPTWFSYIYNLVKHVFEEWATKRLRIVTEAETADALRDYIDDDQIPEEYGGTLRYGNDNHSVRFTSPFEVALRQHVEQVLERSKPHSASPFPCLEAI